MSLKRIIWISFLVLAALGTPLAAHNLSHSNANVLSADGTGPQPPPPPYPPSQQVTLA
jgi:hypothetical protein